MQSKIILTLLVAFPILAYAQDRSSEKDILTIYKGAHSYKEVSVAGKTTEFYVDDQKVADNAIPKVDSLIRAIKNDVDEDNGEMRHRDQDWAQADGDQEQVRQEREQAWRDREQAWRDRDQAEKDREQGVRDRVQGERDRVQGQLDREQGERDRAQGEQDRVQGERDRARAQKDMAAMRAILKYLVEQKIVPDQQHVNSLVLTDATLYVNGVKQPDSIQQTLKQKYGEWAHNGLSYGDCQASNTSIHVDLSGDCCQ